jgi:hypothetical protein
MVPVDNVKQSSLEIKSHWKYKAGLAKTFKITHIVTLEQ